MLNTMPIMLTVDLLDVNIWQYDLIIRADDDDRDLFTLEMFLFISVFI